jgi:hypothetical protein
MKRMCRETLMETWTRRQLAVTALLRGAKVVTDPGTMKHLNAQVAKRKATAERNRMRAPRPVL